MHAPQFNDGIVGIQKSAQMCGSFGMVIFPELTNHVRYEQRILYQGNGIMLVTPNRLFSHDELSRVLAQKCQTLDAI